MTRAIFVIFFILQIYQCVAQNRDINSSFDELDSDMFKIQESFNATEKQIEIVDELAVQLHNLTNSFIKGRMSYEIENDKNHVLNITGMVGDEPSIQECIANLTTETELVFLEAEKVMGVINEDFAQRSVDMKTSKDYIAAKLDNSRLQLRVAYDKCRHEVKCLVELYFEGTIKVKQFQDGAVATGDMIVRRYTEIVEDYLKYLKNLKNLIENNVRDSFTRFINCILANPE